MATTWRLEGRSGAIGPAGTSALACCRFLCLNPITLAMWFLVAVIVGASGGPLAAGLAILVNAALLLAASPLSVTRRLVGRAIAGKQRRDLNELRERRLARAGSSRRGELDELNRLIEQIEECDADEAGRLELGELVDLYVEIAVMIESYRGASLRCGPLTDGEEKEPPAASSSRRLHRDLVRRRIAHREECARRARELEAQLDALLEFVRLVAQRALCPASDELLDRRLEERIWQLDACESALRQLSAGDAGDAGQ